MDGVIEIVIQGKAAPAGSKSANAIYRKGPDGKPVPVMKDGRVAVTVRDANRNAGKWKDTVAAAAAAQYSGPLLDGPLAVEMTIFRQRPKGHYGTGRNAALLKGSAPVYPMGRPDVLKLARGIEDALTGQLWRDDALIVDERLVKRYADDGREYVVVRVWPIRQETIADLVADGIESPLTADERFGQLSLAAA